MSLISPNILDFLAAYWKYAALAIVLIIVICGYQIASCRNRNDEKKIEKLEKIQTESETVANLKQQEKERIEIEVNADIGKTNSAANNFNKTLKRDSGNYKSTDAEDKFCGNQDFCADSTCAIWAKAHPNFICN